VLKNNSLGQIKWEQMVFLGNPEYGCELQPIDFAGVARACGIAGYSVADPADCAAVLRQAMAASGPALVEAVVDPNEPPMPPKVSFDEARHLVEALVREHHAGTPIFLVAHDMGTSVATELMARDIDGSLEMEIGGALLLNGSMVQGAASPTLSQRILRSPLGPLFSRLSSERFFRQQFGSIFSAGHPLTDEEAADQWSLICAGGGRTLNHKTIAYMEERFRHAERWHGALRQWPHPIHLAWGMLDPVATEQVLDAVLALRPSAALTRFEDLGHYPQIEDPERVAAALRAALDA